MSHKKREWEPNGEEIEEFKQRHRSSIMANVYVQLQSLAVEQNLYRDEKEAERFDLAFGRLVDVMQVPRELFQKMVRE